MLVEPRFDFIHHWRPAAKTCKRATLAVPAWTELPYTAQRTRITSYPTLSGFRVATEAVKPRKSCRTQWVEARLARNSRGFWPDSGKGRRISYEGRASYKHAQMRAPYFVKATFGDQLKISVPSYREARVARATRHSCGINYLIGSCL